MSHEPGPGPGSQASGSSTSPSSSLARSSVTSKIALDVEQATDGDGTDINVENLAGVHFQGPPELVPLFTSGERVQITTTTPSGMHIASIKPAPLS